MIAEQDRDAEVFVRGSAASGVSSKGGGFRSRGSIVDNSDIDVGVVSGQLAPGQFPDEHSAYGRAETLAASDMRPRGHHMGVKGFRSVPSREPVIPRPHTPPLERRKPPNVRSREYDSRIEREARARAKDTYEAKKREEERRRGGK
ncbi:MAG: hypothetical protein ACE5GX_12360 [Thermoanaerobaculia bacterium]